MSYTLTQAKDLVLNQGYAICNDDTVEKLREVIKLVFSKDEDIPYGDEIYYFNYNDSWTGYCRFDGKSINLSEIELPIKSVLIPANSLQLGGALTIEMIIALRKQYPNNLDFGDAFDKLLNN